MREIEIIQAIPKIIELIKEGKDWEGIKDICEPLGLTDTAFRDNPNINDFLLSIDYWKLKAIDEIMQL